MKRFALMLCLLAPAAAAHGQAMEGTVYLPPVDDPNDEVAKLTEDLGPAAQLQEALVIGNSELAEAIEIHRQQRTFETKDNVYKILASLSGKVIEEITQLEANEARIRDNLKKMVRKVGAVRGNLDVRVKELARLQEEAREKVAELEEELRMLAREINANPENEEELRRQFRRMLLRAQRFSRQYKAYQSHVLLHRSFAKQVERVLQFLGYFDGNLDMLLQGLGEQRNFLVMKVQLLRDSAEMEQWLRDIGGSNEGVVTVATRILKLQESLGQFDTAMDLIVQLDSVSDVIDTIPDVALSELSDMQEGLRDPRRVEDQYIDHYLKQ